MFNILYSSSCIVCSSNFTSTRVCDDCFSDFKFLPKSSVCSCCGQPFGFESQRRSLCGRCVVGEFSFLKARSAAFYDGQLREMLYNFKYRGKLYCGYIFSDLIINNYPRDIGKFDIIVPVPLHINRLRKREYNQSAIIASEILKITRVEYDPFILKKFRDTKPQVDFSNAGDRKKNVKGTFAVKDGSKVKNKVVMVIDDVFTTGSTTNECSSVLMASGAKEVKVLTALRASPH